MRAGVIVRGEDRGLGLQTREYHRHLSPDAPALLVDMGALGGKGYEIHDEWYPGALRMPFAGDRFADENAVKAWMSEFDVVISAETIYDPQVPDWGRELGVATVVIPNPEFYKHDLQPPQPHPTVWWNPSTWMMDRLPPGSKHVPVPVALDRFDGINESIPQGDRPVRFLHVVGKRAMADRAGTRVVHQALRLVTEPMEVTIRVQRASGTPGGQRVTQVRSAQMKTMGPVEHYWELYAGHDVLVHPRRYGGLNLVGQEAMAAGLGLVMTDCSPNNEMWPIVPIPCRPGRELRMPGGMITPHDSNPYELAQILDRLASTPDALAAARMASRMWAKAHSWEALLPLYLAELEEAADRWQTPAA